MNLYLLRHAKAIDIGTGGIRHDRDRPLAPDGEKKMRLIASGLRQLELGFDLILTSPCVRAQQTAEIVAQELRLKCPLELTTHLAVEADLPALIAEINRQHRQSTEVLLVGHEPSLGQMLSMLVTGGYQLSVDFKKAALAKVSVDSLRWGRCAVLEWFMAPKQLALIGSAKE
jgi:phosphohistidine phosphatase